MVAYLYRYFWIVCIVVLFATAAFWRMEAKDRIRADPTLRQPMNRLYGGFVFWLSLPFLVMGLGIVTGNVDTVFHYMSLDTDNPYIIGFLFLLFAEDALFMYWVFFQHGDQRLALHTEIAHARPKFRAAARFLAIALPLVHGVVLYQATFSPHFGQFLGANGA